MRQPRFLHVACFALAAAVPTPGKRATPSSRIQVLPSGPFAANDGRPAGLDVGYASWNMDAQAFAAMQANISATSNDIVVDFEHKTMHSSFGEPNPAAGWVKNTGLDFVEQGEGAGLWATVDWSALGAQAIVDRIYRYISPVFYADASGRPIGLHSIALTNNPALDSMAAVALSKQSSLFPLSTAAAARSSTPTSGAHPMLLIALSTALGLAADATEQTALTAITALASENTRLKAGQFDPAKHIPLAQHAEVQNALSALQAQVNADKHAVVLSAAVAGGKVLPAQEAYWQAQPLAALQAYLDVAQPITALSAQQTGGKPAPSGAAAAHGLSGDELAVCSATRIDPAKFAATKARLAAQQAAAQAAA
jgi:phage I-like protein